MSSVPVTLSAAPTMRIFRQEIIILADVRIGIDGIFPSWVAQTQAYAYRQGKHVVSELASVSNTIAIFEGGETTQF